MNTSTLDLAYELQLEFGWESSFASGAIDEYKKWLHLRAKACDFEWCKLPPSRVVAMVWNLHRQWTLDYANTCVALGGFIHHYPPAMRVNVAMEQHYSHTIQTYRSEFKEDPPSQYWGPSIAEGRDSMHDRTIPSINPVTITPNQDDYNQSNSHASRAARAKKRGSVTPTRTSLASNAAGGPASLTIAKPASARKANRPTRSPVKPEGSFVLRPLAPGERRRRGRPSADEYISIPDHDKSNDSSTATPVKRSRGRPKKVHHTPTPVVVELPNSSTAAPQAIAPRPTPADISASLSASAPSTEQNPPQKKSDVAPDVHPYSSSQSSSQVAQVNNQKDSAQSPAAPLTAQITPVSTDAPVTTTAPVAAAVIATPAALTSPPVSAATANPPTSAQAASNVANVVPSESASYPVASASPADNSQHSPQGQAQPPKSEQAAESQVASGSTQQPPVNDNSTPSGPTEIVPPAIPFKRPRGRPRKDGSMPRPRNLVTQPPKKVTTPTTTLDNGSAPVASADGSHPTTRSSGCSPTFVGIAVSTNAPASETERAAGQAANAAAAAVEAARNAASELVPQPDKAAAPATGGTTVTAEVAMAEAGATGLPTETAVGDIMDPPLPTTGMSDVLPTANM